MMKKAQASVEAILVVAIVLATISVFFGAYSQQSYETIAETVVRNQVDLELSKASTKHPNCSQTSLVGVNKTGNWTLEFTDNTCAKKILDERTQNEIQRKVSFALDCAKGSEGHCRELSVELEIGD